MSYLVDRLDRRTAIRMGAVGLASFALLLRGDSTPVLAADLSQTTRTAFNAAELQTGPSSLPLDLLGDSDEITWSGGQYSREMLLSADSPKAIVTHRGGEIFADDLTPPYIIQSAPLSLVAARMSIDGSGAGILHGLPDARVTDPSNVILSAMEMRRGRELWALVRRSPDPSKSPIIEEQIDELPEGTTDFIFTMMFADSGNTFGAFGADGSLKRAFELPKPTAEVGEESILAGYRFGKTASAIVSGVAMASPKLK